MDPPFVSQVKVIIALVAVVLLYAEHRWGHCVSERVKQVIAAGLAVAAVGAYFQFARLPFAGYHRWEHFHYYVGSKYAPELGYLKIYECAAVAEAQFGDPRDVSSRTMRDLESNVLVPASRALANPQACTDGFSEARWQQFVSDVRWFRAKSHPREWRKMQNDHGYNPSPVWTVAGRSISSLAPPSDGFLKAIAAIDPLLMLAIIGLLWWAFGWRVATVAVVFWGVQAPSVFGWTGGAFLRQDWLFCTVLSAALMRKGRYVLAGFALGYASMLRLFPALLWAGPAIVVAGYLLRGRSIPSAYKRLAVGGALSACLLIPCSIGVTGPEAYPQFAQRIGTHASTPVSNHMSLRTLFSADPDAKLSKLSDRSLVDPVEPWKQARRDRLHRLRWLHGLSMAAFVGLFVFAVRRFRTPWLAMALSLTAIPMLTDPSCYYYSMWVLGAVLCHMRPSLEIVLVAVAGAGQVIVRHYLDFEDRYVALAALYVALSVLVVVMFTMPPELLQRHRQRAAEGR